MKIISGFIKGKIIWIKFLGLRDVWIEEERD